jgi:hypothetical protein
MMWLVAIASLIGTIGNIYKRRWCFIVWACTNTAWVVYDLSIDAHAQAALMVTYLALSIWGLVKWRPE